MSFLKTEDTSAFFEADGKIFSVKILSFHEMSIGDRENEQIFKVLGGKQSCPVALLGFISHRILTTTDSLIDETEKIYLGATA